MSSNERSKLPSNIFSFLPVIFCLGGAIIFLVVSTLLYWPVPEIAFRTDDSPVAWLSSAQLWAMAILCLRLWQDKALPRYLCIWLCFAMMEMSFDEQFMLHEHWKYHCLEWFNACSHKWVTELPMLLVAIFGSVTGLLLHIHLKNTYQRSLLWGAISIGLFALFLRFFQKPIDLLPYKAAFLVIAEALFTGLLLSLPGREDSHVHSP
jgi:hypothetical protein